MVIQFVINIAVQNAKTNATHPITSNQLEPFPAVVTSRLVHFQTTSAIAKKMPSTRRWPQS